MNFLQVILLGLSLGSIYALLALGFVTIFKGTGVFNLAQGSLLLLGVYIAYLTAPTLGFWLAAAAGIIAAAIAAVLIYIVVALAKTTDHLVLTILTIGIDMVVLVELARSIGTRVLTVRDPWGSASLSILGANIPLARVYAAIVAVVVIAVFFAVFRRTSFGVRMRASSTDPHTAELMGIGQRSVAVASWAIGGALAVIAGIFLAAAPNAGLDATSSLIAFNAIPAIMIGGLDSTEGAVLGGLIVGVGQTAFTAYNSALPFLGHGFGDIAPWVIMIIVLLIRPRGLFGSREVARV